MRNCDGFKVQEKDVEKILDWENKQNDTVEIAFKPSRVILQDFTLVEFLLIGYSVVVALTDLSIWRYFISPFQWGSSCSGLCCNEGGSERSWRRSS